MSPDSILWIVTTFIEGFIQWLNGLTVLNFVSIFWPLLVIDFVRTVAKSVFLLICALYQKVHPLKLKDSVFPKVSLIIPAHNEEKIIARAIESALETDYPYKEVIVVDDGSKDKTYQQAYPYSQKGLIKLLHRDVASSSKATALNYGLVFASGDVIVVVDADTLIERDSLKEIVKPFSIPNVSAVSGNVRIMGGEYGSRNFLVRLQTYEYLISLELGRRFSSIIKSLLIISGAFGAFWKGDVRSLGEYDKDTITEDFDLTFKMRKLGQRLFFADKAVSWTFAPEKWKDWRRQRTRWTKGQVETLWKHRNVLLERGFDARFAVAIFDMVLVDIVVLFLRFVWYGYLLLFYQPTFLYVTVFSVFLYMILELVAFVSAGLLSPRKGDLKNIYLLPAVVLFYRPYYSLVRLKAYFDWIFRRESRW